MTFAEADFRKSSKSDPDKACVSVARRDGRVEVRDSKTRFGGGPRLTLTEAQFDRLVASL